VVEGKVQVKVEDDGSDEVKIEVEHKKKAKK